MLRSIQNTGFDFDQVTLPRATRIGQTWRERRLNQEIVEDWFWNGTYWLSRTEFPEGTWIGGTNTLPSTGLNIPFNVSHNVMITTVYIYGFLGSVNDASNYHQLNIGAEFAISNTTGTLASLSTNVINTLGATPDALLRSKAVINFHVNTIQNNYGRIVLSSSRQGTPSNIGHATTGFDWRLARR